MGSEFKGFAREDLKSIKAHVLVTIGDRDGVRPEHAVEMFRLMPEYPNLAVFRACDHFLLWQSLPKNSCRTIAAFLDALMPAPAGGTRCEASGTGGPTTFVPARACKRRIRSSR